MKERGMFGERWYSVVIASILVMALCIPARAQGEELEHIRGQIVSINGSAMVVKTGDDKEVPLDLPDQITVISLTTGSYTKIDFGIYVGAVAVKLNEYSPNVRG